jgi:hypothetical protein
MGRPTHTFHPTKITSVAVFYNLHNEFQNKDISFQMLTNRALYLYLNNPKFKKQMDTMLKLQVSGSGF